MNKRNSRFLLLSFLLFVQRFEQLDNISHALSITLWTFHEDAETGAMQMNFFTLREPERWLDAHIDPAKIREMTAEDTIGYPETCLLPVAFADKTITASIPATCQIISQATRTTMTLQATITITPNQITYQEAATRPDGSVVFQVPPRGQYVFDRIAD